MPFPLSYKGKIEAWIGDDSLDFSNYRNIFVGALSDELRGLGRADVYVLENMHTLNKGAPQLFFPHGNVVTFGWGTKGRVSFGMTGLSQTVNGDVEIELKDEILIVSYHLSFKTNLMLWTAMCLLALGSWIVFIGSPASTWGLAVVILSFYLLNVTLPYLNDLLVFRKLIKNVVKAVRDNMALNNSLLNSGQ